MAACAVALAGPACIASASATGFVSGHGRSPGGHLEQNEPGGENWTSASSGRPVSCSGDMYIGVPGMPPNVSVTPAGPVVASLGDSTVRNFATPKSSTLIDPSAVSWMFDGLQIAMDNAMGMAAAERGRRAAVRAADHVRDRASPAGEVRARRLSSLRRTLSTMNVRPFILEDVVDAGRAGMDASRAAARASRSRCAREIVAERRPTPARSGT